MYRVKSPFTSTYCSLPSVRMRLSRSSRYLARSASGSKSIPDTVSFRPVEKSLILILLTGWVPTTFRDHSVIRPRLLNDRLAPFDTSDKSRSSGCAPRRSTLKLWCGERERREDLVDYRAEKASLGRASEMARPVAE